MSNTIHPSPHGSVDAVFRQGGSGSGSGSSLGGILWRRKGILTFFVLCGLAGGYAFFTQQDETFQAAATIEVAQQQTQTGIGSATENVVDLAPSLAFIKAEMTSNQVLSSAIQVGQLTAFEDMPESPDAAIGVIRESLELLPAIDGAESINRSIVQVTFDAPDPSLATAVVNAVVQAYEQYVGGRHRKAVDNVVDFFREGRDSILPKLEELENQYTQFRATAPLEWTSDGEAINPFRDEMMRIEETARDLRSEERKLANQLKLVQDSVKGRRDPSEALKEIQFVLDDVGDVEEVTQAFESMVNEDLSIEERLLSLRVQAELVREQYARSHPIRQQIESQLALTEDAYRRLAASRSESQNTVKDIEVQRDEVARDMIRGYVTGLQKKKQLVTNDISDFDKRLDELRDKAHALLKFENENESFLRRIARYQEMLDSFDNQLEKATLPKINNGLEVQVLRPASMGVLVGPLLSRSLVLGGFLGTILGALLGFLVDWSERTFRSPDEVTDSLDASILAHLPLIFTKKSKRRNDKQQNPYADIDPIVCVLHEPHSPASEAVRSIRTSIFHSTHQAPEFGVVQVTSLLPGDGKSTMVANLASSIAGAGRRVVIVDADLRRPNQANLLGIDSELGVTDVLNGDCRVEDALTDTAVEGLSLLNTGPKPSNPAEALMMPEFGQMLDDLRQQFDIVLVDSPPLLAVTDASNIATQVDGVMMVMRIGRRVKPLAQRAMHILRGLHVNIVGIVVNAVGDSGYSATYASAWSERYGGQPGSEYAYGYRRYGKDKYLDAAKGRSVTVRGKSASGMSDRHKSAESLDAVHAAEGSDIEVG
ncbi:polysaccharide biosynthesis tyrosine autokinase [Crateriforma conspicua]|uniref:polysaccharide biosynthesis tyrosine autokinase n=1 Tax=Crateriforma conspicua TaxID=2527996 RepID=UPI001188F9CB|nr:polysaccharide biosynthesis tyrosine autokinase [Crateriforma conspicua]QDV65956.1 Tyrosine-protein kinase ptk [Crateriforma conspicua]